MRHDQGVAVVPALSRNSVKLVNAWRPSFKTKIIGHFLGRSPAGATLVDVGANIGQTLIDFVSVRRAADRYVGFEPNPLCLEQLSALIEVNKYKGMTIVPVGLSDAAGLSHLYLGVRDPMDAGATTVAGLRPGKEVRSAWIPCFRYDEVADALSVESVGIIKIDVEGAELVVLRGMSESLAKQRPPILCEILHRDPVADPVIYRQKISDLWSFLEQAEYRALRVRGSPDDVSTVALERMNMFPDREYDDASISLCDYLFLPKEYNVPSVL